jgi:hypothetical protein
MSIDIYSRIYSYFGYSDGEKIEKYGLKTLYQQIVLNFNRLAFLFFTGIEIEKELNDTYGIFFYMKTPQLENKLCPGINHTNKSILSDIIIYNLKLLKCRILHEEQRDKKSRKIFNYVPYKIHDAMLKERTNIEIDVLEYQKKIFCDKTMMRLIFIPEFLLYGLYNKKVFNIIHTISEKEYKQYGLINVEIKKLMDEIDKLCSDISKDVKSDDNKDTIYKVDIKSIKLLIDRIYDLYFKFVINDSEIQFSNSRQILEGIINDIKKKFKEDISIILKRHSNELIIKYSDIPFTTNPNSEQYYYNNKLYVTQILFQQSEEISCTEIQLESVKQQLNINNFKSLIEKNQKHLFQLMGLLCYRFYEFSVYIENIESMLVPYQNEMINLLSNTTNVKRLMDTISQIKTNLPKQIVGGINDIESDIMEKVKKANEILLEFKNIEEQRISLQVEEPEINTEIKAKINTEIKAKMNDLFDNIVDILYEIFNHISKNLKYLSEIFVNHITQSSTYLVQFNVLFYYIELLLEYFESDNKNLLGFNEEFVNLFGKNIPNCNQQYVNCLSIKSDTYIQQLIDIVTYIMTCNYLNKEESNKVFRTIHGIILFVIAMIDNVMMDKNSNNGKIFKEMINKRINDISQDSINLEIAYYSPINRRIHQLIFITNNNMNKFYIVYSFIQTLMRINDMEQFTKLLDSLMANGGKFTDNKDVFLKLKIIYYFIRIIGRNIDVNDIETVETLIHNFDYIKNTETTVSNANILEQLLYSLNDGENDGEKLNNNRQKKKIESQNDLINKMKSILLKICFNNPPTGYNLFKDIGINSIIYEEIFYEALEIINKWGFKRKGIRKQIIEYLDNIGQVFKNEEEKNILVNFFVFIVTTNYDIINKLNNEMQNMMNIELNKPLKEEQKIELKLNPINHDSGSHIKHIATQQELQKPQEPQASPEIFPKPSPLPPPVILNPTPPRGSPPQIHQYQNLSQESSSILSSNESLVDQSFRELQKRQEPSPSPEPQASSNSSHVSSNLSHTIQEQPSPPPQEPQELHVSSNSSQVSSIPSHTTQELPSSSPQESQEPQSSSNSSQASSNPSPTTQEQPSPPPQEPQEPQSSSNSSQASSNPSPTTQEQPSPPPQEPQKVQQAPPLNTLVQQPPQELHAPLPASQEPPSPSSNQQPQYEPPPKPPQTQTYKSTQELPSNPSLVPQTLQEPRSQQGQKRGKGNQTSIFQILATLPANIESTINIPYPPPPPSQSHPYGKNRDPSKLPPPPPQLSSSLPPQLPQPPRPPPTQLQSSLPPQPPPPLQLPSSPPQSSQSSQSPPQQLPSSQSSQSSSSQSSPPPPPLPPQLKKRTQLSSSISSLQPQFNATSVRENIQEPRNIQNNRNNGIVHSIVDKNRNSSKNKGIFQSIFGKLLRRENKPKFNNITSKKNNSNLKNSKRWFYFSKLTNPVQIIRYGVNRFKNMVSSKEKIREALGMTKNGNPKHKSNGVSQNPGAQTETAVAKATNPGVNSGASVVNQGTSSTNPRTSKANKGIIHGQISQSVNPENKFNTPQSESLRVINHTNKPLDFPIHHTNKPLDFPINHTNQPLDILSKLSTNRNNPVTNVLSTTRNNLSLVKEKGIITKIKGLDITEQYRLLYLLYKDKDEYKKLMEKILGDFNKKYSSKFLIYIDNFCKNN